MRRWREEEEEGGGRESGGGREEEEEEEEQMVAVVVVLVLLALRQEYIFRGYSADHYWPWLVFLSDLISSRAADPKETMSYRIEGENFYPSMGRVRGFLRR